MYKTDLYPSMHATGRYLNHHIQQCVPVTQIHANNACWFNRCVYQRFPYKKMGKWECWEAETTLLWTGNCHSSLAGDELCIQALSTRWQGYNWPRHGISSGPMMLSSFHRCLLVHTTHLLDVRRSHIHDISHISCYHFVVCANLKNLWIPVFGVKT
jgi:hypothetical protein